MNIKNSIYANGISDGLTIRNGRLMNHRPDETTGISKACEVRKGMKEANKISVLKTAMTASKMECDANSSMSILGKRR
jgi:hypothetical protein